MSSSTSARCGIEECNSSPIKDSIVLNVLACESASEPIYVHDAAGVTDGLAHACIDDGVECHCATVTDSVMFECEVRCEATL